MKRKINPILRFYLLSLLFITTWYLLYSFGLSNLDFTAWTKEERKFMLIYSGASLLFYYIIKGIKNFNN